MRRFADFATRCRLQSCLVRSALCLMLAGFVDFARATAVAVIAESPNGDVDPGSLQMVESSAESALMEAAGVRLISRRHLEKILAEQGLAYENIVNDRARLGQLAGADVLLVVSITENNAGAHRETISAYGFTENKVTPYSSAEILVKGLSVSTGEVVVQRQFNKRLSSSSRALDSCAEQMKKSLVRLDLASAKSEVSLARHQIVIRPTANGQDIQGLDLYIDGNFVGNTPITTDVEEGVRDIALRQRDNTVWNNRVRISAPMWLKPELGSL